jgi:hypothetical protein
VWSSYKKDLKRDLFYNKVLQLLEDGTSSSEMLVKMDPPAERRRGFNEAYAGAEGPHIKALVAVGAVEPAWSAHTGDRKMKMNSSPEIDVAQVGIPGEGGASDSAAVKKLRDEEEAQNTRPLVEKGADNGRKGGKRLDLVSGSGWKAEETRSAEEGGFILLPLTWDATATARRPPMRTAAAAPTTTKTATTGRD